MFFVNAPVVSPRTASDDLRPIWPLAAQMAAALILMICLAALGWTAYQQRHAPAGAPVNNDYVIDLNHADHAELLQLPGVGESLASRIEAYRDQHGPFQTVEELRRVHGIGPVTLARLSLYVGTSKSSAAGRSPAQTSKEDSGKAPVKPQRRNQEKAMDQDQGNKP
jgi:competence protein ComEA